MTTPILVKIIGAPVACKDGIKESWRKVAEWAAGQLQARYGDGVSVQYFDLFDPDCPTIPPESQLPVVIVDGVLESSGGKFLFRSFARKSMNLGKPINFRMFLGDKNDGRSCHQTIILPGPLSYAVDFPGHGGWRRDGLSNSRC